MWVGVQGMGRRAMALLGRSRKAALPPLRRRHRWSKRNCLGSQLGAEEPEAGPSSPWRPRSGKAALGVDLGGSRPGSQPELKREHRTHVLVGSGVRGGGRGFTQFL